MALDLEQFLSGRLGELREDHPDRSFLESQHQKDIPKPPTELFGALEKSKELGFTFEPIYFPGVQLKESSIWPGTGIKPEPWFWEQIKNGSISKNSATLLAGWYLIEAIQKPDYRSGRQLSVDNALGPHLESLRKQGKIAVPEEYKHVPTTSRFAVSWDEIHSAVMPEVSKLLSVNKKQIRLPREIEFNMAGNLYHPEWGQTNTWEWFEDKFGDASRLSGGDSDRGGLAVVYCHWSDYRFDYLGFRLLVGFPQKS